MIERLLKVGHSPSGALGLVIITFCYGLSAVFLFTDIDANLISKDIMMPPIFMNGGLWQYPLGTDDLGRNLLSRLIAGASVTLVIASSVALIAVTLGSSIGIYAGTQNNRMTSALETGTKVFMAFPSIFPAIVFLAIAGPGVLNIIVSLSLLHIPRIAREIAFTARFEMGQPYIQAAKSFGYSKWHILRQELLPNCLPAILTRASLCLGEAVLETSALGFLGIGLKPENAEWGMMLADARLYIESSPWLVFLPGFSIFILVIGFNLLGNALRDALDPRTEVVKCSS